MNQNEILRNLTFCALDIETTGINPVFHRIVDIGIVKFNMTGIIDKFESLINPGIPIPAETTMIHGITDEMVKSSPLISEKIVPVIDFIRNSHLVIQNPEFDLSFIEMTCRKNNIKIKLDAFDTVRLARKALPDLKNHKLETLSNHFGITGDPHRALPDAFACAEIFRNIIIKLDKKGRWKMKDLIAYHGNPIRPRKLKITQAPSNFRGMAKGKFYRIIYTDSDGNITEREIQPVEFVIYGKKKYMEAFCFLRKENRFFLADRIIEITEINGSYLTSQ
jgi:DNA polymerase III epsilon subunit family exonuclease